MGVDPRSDGATAVPRSRPHARGGGPQPVSYDPDEGTSSPRTWGWTAALAACKASVGSKADRKRLLEEFYLDAKQHVESLRSAAEASDTDAALDRALAADDGLEG